MPQQNSRIGAPTITAAHPASRMGPCSLVSRVCNPQITRAKLANIVTMKRTVPISTSYLNYTIIRIPKSSP
ncbi:MAG: hypothetical protein AAB792_01985, partial [Patescibacteria group bacterium]